MSEKQFFPRTKSLKTDEHFRPPVPAECSKCLFSKIRQAEEWWALPSSHRCDGF